jgi:hypothetical protein
MALAALVDPGDLSSSISVCESFFIDQHVPSLPSPHDLWQRFHHHGLAPWLHSCHLHSQEPYLLTP